MKEMIEEIVGTIKTVFIFGVPVLLATAGIYKSITFYLDKRPSAQIYGLAQKIETEKMPIVFEDETTFIFGKDLIIKIPYPDKSGYYTITYIGTDGLKGKLKGIAPDVAEFRLRK